MSNINSNNQLPKRRRLLTLGKRVFSRFMLKSETFDEKGKRHAVGEPALSFHDGAEEHWVHGRLQSTDDRPALHINESNACEVKAVSWNDCHQHEVLDLTPFTQVWCDDGFIHRDGAPAIVNCGDEDAYFEEWWQHGLRHRDGGPAVQAVDVWKWFQLGLLHREDGPAVDFASAIRPGIYPPNWYSSWFWHGHEMLSRAFFFHGFDYDKVPPEFVLRALAYAYAHSGYAVTTPEAVARATTIFPELASFLKTAEVIGMTGEDVAQRINDVMAGRETCEVYAVEDFLDLEP